MLSKVACGLSIAGVKVSMDHTAITLSFAVFGPALKDMYTALVDVFD